LYDISGEIKVDVAIVSNEKWSPHSCSLSLALNVYRYLSFETYLFKR